MCTLRLVEAITHVSVYRPKCLVRAINLLENMLGFPNDFSNVP